VTGRVALRELVKTLVSPGKNWNHQTDSQKAGWKETSEQPYLQESKILVQFNSFARTLRRSSAELTSGERMLVLSPPCFRARSLSGQHLRFCLLGRRAMDQRSWFLDGFQKSKRGEQLENFTHEKRIR
jgi:hypothetical protein